MGVVGEGSVMSLSLSLSTQCAVTSSILAHEFNELAEELSLTDDNGTVCHVEHHHDHEEDEEDHHEDEEGYEEEHDHGKL